LQTLENRGKVGMRVTAVRGSTAVWIPSTP
jgi:hypothetical protein